MEKLADGCLGWRTKLSEEYDNVSLLFSNSSREEGVFLSPPNFQLEFIKTFNFVYYAFVTLI